MCSARTSEIAVEGLLGDLKARVNHANVAFQVKQSVDDMLLAVQQRYSDGVIAERQAALKSAQDELERARKALADMQQEHELASVQLKETSAASQQKSVEVANHVAALQSQIQQLEEDHKALDYKQNLALATRDVSALPFQAKITVFQFCEVDDLSRCISVSHAWKRSLDLDMLWKIFLVRRVLRKKKLEEKIKQRMDPSQNKLAIHVSLDGSMSLTKENVFQQCMTHVKRTLETIASKHEDLQSKLQAEEKIRKFLLARLRRSRTDLAEITQERIDLERKLAENKATMASLAQEVAALEKQAKKVKEDLAIIKKKVQEDRSNYDMKISELEGEVKKAENDEEMINLKRSRKVLANEVKWLRQNVSKKIETREEYRRNLVQLKQILNTTTAGVQQ